MSSELFREGGRAHTSFVCKAAPLQHTGASVFIFHLSQLGNRCRMTGDLAVLGLLWTASRRLVNIWSGGISGGERTNPAGVRAHYHSYFKHQPDENIKTKPENSPNVHSYDWSKMSFCAVMGCTVCRTEGALASKSYKEFIYMLNLFEAVFWLQIIISKL